MQPLRKVQGATHFKQVALYGVFVCVTIFSNTRWQATHPSMENGEMTC